MKKVIRNVFVLVLTLILAFCGLTLMFTGCGEEGAESASGKVYSNGGTVVRYGDYVYFINGVPDYTDEDGNTNINGEVVKGALYRAKIADNRPDPDTAESKEIAEIGEAEYNKTNDGLYDVLDFDYERRDYIQLGQYTIGSETESATYVDDQGRVRQNIIPTNDKASAYYISVEPVVNMKIGTSGYDGGFWIYDGIIYFASPDTDRDSDGNVQYERASFYSYNISNGSLNKLYTTTEANSAIPYGFYKQGDSVYLVTYENYYADADDEELGIKTGYIVCTRIVNGNAKKTEELVEGVTGAYFPSSENYDPADNPANTAEDFIYFTRKNTRTDDGSASGSTLEMIYPSAINGGDNTRFAIAKSTQGTIGIEGIAGGYLYYTRTQSSGKTALICDSLYNELVEHDKSYADSPVAAPMKDIEFTICGDTSVYTNIVPIANDDPLEEKDPCFIGEKSDGIYRVSADGNAQGSGAASVEVKLYNGSFTLMGQYGGRIYGTVTIGSEDSESEEDNSTTWFCSASSFESFDNQTVTPISIIHAPNVDNYSLDFFTLDFAKADGDAADATETYVAFFSNYTSLATNYMMLNKLGGTWDSLADIQLGEVHFTEETPIVCYDHNCLNPNHDHSAWDDYSEDEEEGTGDGTESGTGEVAV